MRRAPALVAVLSVALLAVLAASSSCSAPPSSKSSENRTAATDAGGTAAKIALPPRPMGEADPKAAEVAKELTDAMGGQRTWDVLPYFRFDFVVVREGKELARYKHWWDKKNGRCRVEGPDDKGRTVTAIFNLSDRKGKSFTDGIVDTDSANIANILQMGYERWVNDTYWIVMPFKLRDPGAHLKYDRLRKDVDGTEHDVLGLSFDSGVGLTPGDHYTIYVNRRTHLVDKWDMMLQDQKPPPGVATWEGWSQIGPVKLALLHRVEGKPVMIRFENVAAPQTMDETVFTYARVRG